MIDFDHLNIDDAIKDQKEMIEWHTNQQQVIDDRSEKYIKYHYQIIDWLEELKERRNKDGEQTEACGKK